MELQFSRQAKSCLRLWSGGTRESEQTLELRLPDSMPDVGSVTGAWGQVLIRGKEWRDTGMSVSGGVLAWVLYCPEGGGAQILEGWVPFQLRWDFPQTQYDGKILVLPLLQSLEARCVSARKLMLRANVSVSAEAYEPTELVWFTPGEIPTDVQVLRRTYPLCVNVEAGEKQFQLEEEVQLPAECAAGKLLRCNVQPELIDRKIMGDRVVFRGIASVETLILCADEVRSISQEISFSQYAQLERSYGESAAVNVYPILTSLEPDLTEAGALRLNMGMTGQYLISDTLAAELVEDVYSPTRDVTPETELLQTPVILEQSRTIHHAHQPIQLPEGTIRDCCFCCAQPSMRREGEQMVMELKGSFPVLSSAGSGELQGQTVRWEDGMSFPADPETDMLIRCQLSGKAVAMETDQNLNCDLAIERICLSSRGIPMIRSLELGDVQEGNPDKPALVLQRAGERELWHIARENGSTVEMIRKANGLEGEPEPGTMLLIPVL